MNSCNYKNRLSGSPPYKKSDQDCKIPCLAKNHGIDIPIDQSGLCLFHSKDVTWKIQNNFHEKVIWYITLLNSLVEIKKIECEGFCFVGFSKKVKVFENGQLNFTTIDFSKLHIEKPINFNSSIFEASSLEFSNSCFEGSVNFEMCEFKGDFNFNNCRVKDISFKNSKFEGFNNFSRLTIEGNACFTGVFFYQGGNFSKSNFKGDTLFDYVLFNALPEYGHIDFKASIFNGKVDFTASVFNGKVDFSQVMFTKDAMFVAVVFPLVYEVLFNEIEIDNNAQLLFRGEEKKKVFNSFTRFLIDENKIKGRIIFEHANLNYLNQSDKLAIVKLSRTPNSIVYIGYGCLQYKLSTPLKTIYIDEHNQEFIIEITGLLANYLGKSKSCNIGIEVPNKTEEFVQFFFFSDSNMPYSEWIQLLTTASESLFGGSDEGIALCGEDQFLYQDAQFALFGILMRVGLRIKNKNWSESNTKSLINSISFEDSPVKEITKKVFNLINVNFKFAQKIIGKSNSVTQVQIGAVKNNQSASINEMEE